MADEITKPVQQEQAAEQPVRDDAQTAADANDAGSSATQDVASEDKVKETLRKIREERDAAAKRAKELERQLLEQKAALERELAVARAKLEGKSDVEIKLTQLEQELERQRAERQAIESELAERKRQSAVAGAVTKAAAKLEQQGMHVTLSDDVVNYVARYIHLGDDDDENVEAVAVALRAWAKPKSASHPPIPASAPTLQPQQPAQQGPPRRPLDGMTRDQLFKELMAAFVSGDPQRLAEVQSALNKLK